MIVVGALSGIWEGPRAFASDPLLGGLERELTHLGGVPLLHRGQVVRARDDVPPVCVHPEDLHAAELLPGVEPACPSSVSVWMRH